MPGATPAKVSDDWKAPPILYSTPAWVSKVIVPLGNAQVGCTTLATVGTLGAVGTASIVIDDPVDTQVVSFVSLTLTV